MNDFENAKINYEKSIKINNDYPNSLYNLGITLMEAGKNDEAIHVFENYLNKYPNSIDSKKVNDIIKKLK